MAASFSASGKVGFAGTTAGDTASTNYSAGFAAGAALARADATATTVLAGTALARPTTATRRRPLS